MTIGASFRKYWDKISTNMLMEIRLMRMVRKPPTLVWVFPVTVGNPILNLSPRMSRDLIPNFTDGVVLEGFLLISFDYKRSLTR